MNSVCPLLFLFASSWSAGGVSGQDVQTPQQVAQSTVIDAGARRLTPSDYGWTELMDASVKGDLAKVQELLARGAEVDAKDNGGRTALMVAANVAVAQALIAKGADVNAKSSNGRTALVEAVTWNRTDVARVLLDKGADPNAKGSLGPVLSDAAGRGNAVIVRALLEKGADPNAKASTGDTPLLHAAALRNGAVVDALLDKGADPNTKDRYGQSPLILAAERGDEAIVRSLLRKGADPNIIAPFSSMGGASADTPLKRASANGGTGTARALLDGGADINGKGKSGDTALMIAAQAGREGVVRLLLDKGADVDARNEAGRSALSIAEGARHKRVVRLLLAKEASAAAREKRGAAFLLYFQSSGEQCALKNWNPGDRSGKVLLNLSRCPDDVFFAEEAAALIAVTGTAIQEIWVKPAARLKITARLPDTDKAILAGYLPDGRLAIVHEKVGAADDSTLSLFSFDGRNWSLVKSKNCGRFFTVEKCLERQIRGRNWQDWGDDTQIWHPKLALNPFVTARGPATRKGERFFLDKGDTNKEERTWGYVKFSVESHRSVLFYESQLVQGDADEAMVTSSIFLQTYKDGSPAAIAEGQLNTAIEQKYLLISLYPADLRLIDLETGEEPIEGMKFAFWAH